MFANSFRALAWIPVLLFATAIPAAAQNVVGRVIGHPDEEPIAGAVLVLLDADGKPVRGVLSNQAGRFVLPAPALGSYGLRVEMIGRKTFETQIVVGSGGPTFLDVALVSVPIELDELRVRAASRCEIGPDVGEATLQVWGEVRKAMRSEAVARGQAVYEFDILHERRTYTPGTSQLVNRVVNEGTSVATTPFWTLPPDEIARNGYARKRNVDETSIYGPTSEIFLSPEFQDTHCFSLKRDDDRIGLVFKPIPDRKVTDIEGVIWVEAATLELQRVEFKYKRLPYGLAIGNYSGFAEFQRLESGAWIIAHWQLTTPVEVTEASVTALEPLYAERSVEEDEEPALGQDTGQDFVR